MTVTRTFIHLEDPGHGWLLVSAEDLALTGLKPRNFSTCSSARGGTYALEEDCDMPLFLKALTAKGIPFHIQIQHVRGDAHVRHWRDIHPG